MLAVLCCFWVYFYPDHFGMLFLMSDSPPRFRPWVTVWPTYSPSQDWWQTAWWQEEGKGRWRGADHCQRKLCTGCVSCSVTTPSQTAHLLPQRAENGLRGRRGQGRHKSQICVVAVFSPSGTHTSVCVVAEVVWGRGGRIGYVLKIMWETIKFGVGFSLK